MLKICFVELRDDKREAGGSLGANSIIYAARSAGYNIDVLDQTSNGYDIELLSVHFYTGYPLVKRMPKRAKYRIIGGSPLKNNPLPLIRFCDALCLGEGESWIAAALGILSETNDIERLASLPGTIVSKLWVKGSPVPPPNFEPQIPKNPPFLRNDDGQTGRNKAWEIELTRGCPFNCKFCALSSGKNYRYMPLADVKMAIDKIDTSKCRAVDFISAESGSHPEFNKIIGYLKDKGITYRFGTSIRLEQILNGEVSTVSNNKLRIGIDGLSEETRFQAEKRITDDMIYKLFEKCIREGHVNFKLYMIIGYPWEDDKRFDADFAKFDALISRIKPLALKKNIIIEINWTPLLPLKGTPLEGTVPTYNYRMYEKISMWHAINRHPQKNKGLYIKEILPSVPWQYNKLLKIAVGDEDTL